jgi:hypothetical protein
MWRQIGVVFVAFGCGIGGAVAARPLLSASASPDADRSVLVPVVPARLLDTRPGSLTVDGQFAGGGPVGPGATLSLVVGGRVPVPPDATAVVLNVTALDASTLTYLTLWPHGAAQPTASNLNPSPGQPPTPNLVTVGLGSGNVDIFNFAGNVHVLADVTGYYSSSQVEIATAVAQAVARTRPLFAHLSPGFIIDLIPVGPATTIAQVMVTTPVAGMLDVQLDSTAQVNIPAAPNGPLTGRIALALCTVPDVIPNFDGDPACTVTRLDKVVKPTGAFLTDTALAPVTMRLVRPVPAGTTTIYVNGSALGGDGGLSFGVEVNAVLAPTEPALPDAVLVVQFVE